MDDSPLAPLCVLVFIGHDSGQYTEWRSMFHVFLKLDNLSARRTIAKEFIHNRYLIAGQSPSRKCPHYSAAKHHLITLPTQKMFLKRKLVTCKKQIIRHGHAPARLPMLEYTLHAVQESFYVLNVMQLIG